MSLEVHGATECPPTVLLLPSSCELLPVEMPSVAERGALRLNAEKQFKPLPLEGMSSFILL